MSRIKIGDRVSKLPVGSMLGEHCCFFNPDGTLGERVTSAIKIGKRVSAIGKLFVASIGNP